MTKHPAYRFLLFIVTATCVFGGVFTVFRVLASVGNAAEPTPNDQSAIIGNIVAASQVDLPVADSGGSISSSVVGGSSGVISNSGFSNNTVGVGSSNKLPKGSVSRTMIIVKSGKKNSGNANNTLTIAVTPTTTATLSNDLSQFELSIADAVRSISTPIQAPIPQTVASSVPSSSASSTASTTVTQTSTDVTDVADASTTLPYVVGSFSDLAGWEQEWGTVSVASSSLAIAATPSSTGGEALLANSNDWTNYLATVVVDWQKGETFSLIARYNPGMNNVSCEFLNDGEVSIYRTLGGQRTLLGMGTIPNFNSANTLTASIQVKNNHVQCGLNGSIVTDYLDYGMPQILLSGALDIETWDPAPGTAQIFVQSVDVQPLY